MNDRLRERFAESSERLRDRIDGPLGHAEKLARGAAGWFPVRVWRRFLRHDGFLLAAVIAIALAPSQTPTPENTMYTTAKKANSD